MVRKNLAHLKENFTALIGQFFTSNGQHFSKSFSKCHPIVPILHYHFVILGIKIVKKFESIIIFSITSEATTHTSGSFCPFFIDFSQFYIIPPGIFIDIIIKPNG